MMNTFKTTALILTLLSAVTLNGQEVLDKIAGDACSCMAAKDLSPTDQEALQMEVSMCLMQKIGNYQSQLQEQLNVDFSNQAALQEMGQKVGMKMASICPETMMKIAQVQASGSGSVSVESVSRLEGTVVGVEGDEFTLIAVKDAGGRTQKFLWLRYFEGSDAFLKNPEALVGKKVRLSYAPLEAFSPKLNEYLQRNEIRSLEIVN